MRAETVNKISSVGTLIMFSSVLLFGILFLAVAILINGQKIPENFIETEATISKIDAIYLGTDYDADGMLVENYDYHVYVDYSYQGVVYSDCEYGKYDSLMKEGNTVLLYLNPENPAEFMADPSGNFIFIIVGAVVVLIGIGGLAYTVVKKKGSAE